jgi:hypothetical protein
MSGKILLIAFLLSFIGNCTKVETKENLPPKEVVVEKTKEPEIEKPKTPEPPKEVVKFDLNKLSETGKNAYNTLLNAQSFESTHIGAAGSFSKLAESLGILQKEKNADEALKALLKNATLPGQLYALCGIFYTDYDFFAKEVENYKSNQELIQDVSGCMISQRKVAEIVESKNPKVAIIKPAETLEDFWKAHQGKEGQGISFDISHGAYPAQFKEAFEKEQKKKV